MAESGNRIVGTLPILILLQLTLATNAFAQLLAATHFPLAEGQTWEYLENDTIPVTIEVLSGLENVNGVDTFVLETIGGEVGVLQQRYTNDAFGFRFHRASDADGGGIFVPPVQVLEEEIVIGQTINSAGEIDVGGGFMFPYSASTDVVGPATITVPLGTFDTIVIELTIAINGNPTTDRVYLAEGIGVVRAEANIFAPGGITELVAVPEPGFVSALLPAMFLMGLAGVGKKAPISSPLIVIHSDK